MEATAVVSAIALVLSLIAQQAPSPGTRANRADEGSIRLHARLVNLNVRVADPSGKPVQQLNRDDFVVLEDNVPQELTYFEPVTAPLNLLLLLDLSGSIGSKLQVMKKAARKFVDSLGRNDRVAVATFTTRFRIESDFTTDRNLLKKRIDQIVNPGGDTAVYDAIWAALDMLGTTKDAR